MKYFNQYRSFFIPYILFVITLTTLILCNEKADLHLWLTSFYTPVGDVFFRYYTEVGGSFPYLIIAGLLFYRLRLALFILVTQLASGLLSQIAKHAWNEPRPILFFKENFPNVELHRIAGVDLHASHSFPSGHTITAFVFFLALAFYTKRPSLHFLYFVLALLVGVSRVYLSQHFALDVLVGSLIGVATTMLCQYYFEKQPMKWANGTLQDVILRKKHA